MEKYNCIDISDKRTKYLFLKLPSKLYNGDNPQSMKIEKQILCGKHPISKDVTVFPFVVIDKYGKAISRCLLTYYTDDSSAYVGYFESYDNIEAVKLLFSTVEKKAIADKKSELIGPIDVSIYINYRFKTNLFDKTYTSEPYNKEYYPRLWEECGFFVRDKYVSNQLRKIEPADIDERLKRIYDRYASRDYQFITPTKKTFNRCMADVYDSMMRLYTDFPCFKPISKSQYLKLFLPLRKVINFDMVKLVYRKGKLCAFCVAIPNYRYLTLGKLTIKKLLSIMRVKKSPDEYVVLYMGAERSSSGLGGALAHLLRNEFYRLNCTSISALIHEGQVTGEMYDCLYTYQFEYVLLSKPIN